MKKIIFSITFLFFFCVSPSFAQSSITDSALDFLKSKQDVTGKITTGFSAPSQWSAIAFHAYAIDVETVKKSTTSLQEFLLVDSPTNTAATDWETRILAIVAIGGNPTSFNNINYIEHLESFYVQDQIGDICSLNDDIFGLLALLASGETSQTTIKQGTLDFLISKQDSDGGFGFSSPGCDWYSTSADMTAAAVQALVKARQTGFINPTLDTAIERAKNYLLANQNADGGFGYYGSSDTDTTGWVLIAFNALDMKESQQATKAKTYLLANQSQSDGGFMAFDYGTNTFVSNATTTAHALIALSGNTWILSVYDSAQSTTPLPTRLPIPTNTPTPTPKSSSGLLSVEQSNVIYQTITITTTPTIRKATKTQEEDVLGVENNSTHQEIEKKSTDSYKTVAVLSASQNPAFLAIALGSFCIAVALLFFRKMKT